MADPGFPLLEISVRQIRVRTLRTLLETPFGHIMPSKVWYLLLALILTIIEIQEVSTFECIPSLCSFVNCSRFERVCQEPRAVRIKNGGMCGCCDKCYLLKRKGEECFVLLQKFGKVDARCELGTVCKLMTLKCE